jgi:hypothetical protein
MDEQLTELRIEGSVIDLRYVRESDLEAYYASMQDPESNRLTGTQKEFTLDEIAAWIRKIGVTNVDRVDFMIVLKESSKLLGEVVLNEIDSINRITNIRIGISRDAASRQRLRHGSYDSYAPLWLRNVEVASNPPGRLRFQSTCHSSVREDRLSTGGITAGHSVLGRGVS